MKLDKKGITRLVFIFKYFVIKIPKFTYSHKHFLQGCYANWSERNFTKIFKDIDWDGETNLYNLISPSYFCSYFGLFQIQARCKPLLRDLTEMEKELYKPLCEKDNKKENFGWYKGRLVCLDYP